MVFAYITARLLLFATAAGRDVGGQPTDEPVAAPLPAVITQVGPTTVAGGWAL